MVNIVPLEKEDLQEHQNPQKDLVSKKQQLGLRPMRSIRNQRRKSNVKELKMMQNSQDYELNFDKDSDSVYASGFVKHSNTRDKFNEEHSEKSGAGSLHSLRNPASMHSQIQVSEFEPQKLASKHLIQKSTEEKKKKEKRRPSKVETKQQALGDNLAVKKFEHKPSSIARQNTHRSGKQEGGTIGENDSPLNKAKIQNEFNRGKSFVKSPDSVSRLSIQKQLKHQISVRKNVNTQKKEEVLKSELESIKNEMMSQLQRMQEIQSSLLGVPPSATLKKPEEDQYLSPTRIKPAPRAGSQQSVSLRQMRKMTIAMRNSIHSENQQVMNHIALKAEKKEFKLNLQKNRKSSSENQDEKSSSSCSSYNIHSKSIPKVENLSSKSDSMKEKYSQKGSLNKIHPSSQNSISKLSRGKLDDEAMNSTRQLMSISQTNNLQNNFDSYKFQTADSEEKLLNGSEALPQTTAQPAEAKPSFFRTKSTQKSGKVNSINPQSPLAKSGRDQIRQKKQAGKFGKQRNFKHKAAELYAMGECQRDLLQPEYFIVLPDDQMKMIWDVIMLCLIVTTSIMTPFTISFYDDEANLSILIYNYVVDGLFAFDIVMNFFMAYYDENHELMIDRKTIAKNYLKGWFAYDMASISSLLILIPGMTNTNWLKFFRIVRVLRIAKLVKNNPTIAKLFQDNLKISSGMERLFFFMIAVLIFTHFMACLWCFQAYVQDFPHDCWVVREGLDLDNNIELYVASLYFILATLATVGYGDIAANNTIERILCIVIMSFGVFVFSFSIGSLSSVITSIDNNLIKLKEKQKILKILKKQHNIPFVLEDKILKALRYDYRKSNQDKSEFLNNLPTNLKTELALVMHQKVIEDIAWLQQKEDQFVSAAAPRFKSIRFNAGDILFKQGTPNEDIFFIISGKVAFVLPEYNDLVFVTLERGEYVGDIDFAANKDKGIRIFTVKALTRTEAYFLNVSDLHWLELYFQDIMLQFFDNAEIRYKQAKKMRAKAEKHIIKQSEAIIQFQVQKAILKAKQLNSNSPVSKHFEEERVIENFNARKGLGGEIAKLKQSGKDSGTIESADSFKTSSSETSSEKSHATSTFKSDTSFVDESENKAEGSNNKSFSKSSNSLGEDTEEEKEEEKKIEFSNKTRRGSTQRISQFGAFGNIKIRDLNESQKIIEEDESNCSDLTSIRKSKRGAARKTSTFANSKTQKTTNSYEETSPAGRGQSPNTTVKISQINNQVSKQESPQRNSLTVPLTNRKSIQSDNYESPVLRRQSVNQVRERKSTLVSQAPISPSGSSLQTSLIENQNSPKQPSQPYSNTPAAVPFSFGAVNLPKQQTFKEETKGEEHSIKEKNSDPIEQAKETPQFKIQIHEAQSSNEKITKPEIENSDNDLNIPKSDVSKTTKKSNESTQRKLKEKRHHSIQMNSQEIENDSSAQEESKRSTHLNKKELQKQITKRKTSVAISGEAMNQLTQLLQNQQQKLIEPQMTKTSSIERRHTQNNVALSGFHPIEPNKKQRKKKDNDDSKSHFTTQRSLKIVKTTVGGTAQVSNFGVINATMEHNPLIDSMAKKIEALKKKARQGNHTSGSDNEKFSTDIKREIKDMMKQNQEQNKVQNQLNLQILQTLKKLTEQVEMQSESMGTNLQNKSMGSQGDFLVDSDNDKGALKSSNRSGSSKNMKLSASGRGNKKQQLINIEKQNIPANLARTDSETRNETRNETGEVKQRLMNSAKPEKRVNEL